MDSIELSGMTLTDEAGGDLLELDEIIDLFDDSFRRPVVGSAQQRKPAKQGDEFPERMTGANRQNQYPEDQGPIDPFAGWGKEQYESARKAAGLPEDASPSDIEKFWDKELVDRIDREGGNDAEYDSEKAARQEARDKKTVGRVKAKAERDRKAGKTPESFESLSDDLKKSNKFSAEQIDLTETHKCQHCESNDVDWPGAICDSCASAEGVTEDFPPDQTDQDAETTAAPEDAPTAIEPEEEPLVPIPLSAPSIIPDRDPDVESSYYTSLTITIEGNDSGLSPDLYYDIGEGWVEYTGPITLEKTSEIVAKAVATAELIALGYEDSEIEFADFTVRCATPTFSVASGIKYGETELIILCDTPDAVIRFTAGESPEDPTPTTGTEDYYLVMDGGIGSGETSITVKAIATKEGCETSAVANSGTYTFKCGAVVATDVTVSGTELSATLSSKTGGVETVGASIAYDLTLKDEGFVLFYSSGSVVSGGQITASGSGYDLALATITSAVATKDGYQDSDEFSGQIYPL